MRCHSPAAPRPLVDRREPGRETSYGNAGIIQREGVRPRAFPRDLGELLRIASKQGLDTCYDLAALPGYAPVLAKYWWNPAPARHREAPRPREPIDFLVGIQGQFHAGPFHHATDGVT